MPLPSSELVSAISHPLRRRILFAYAERRVECASASELATAMDVEVAQVAYHLKILAGADILLPARDDNGEGAGEAHYRWKLGVKAEWLLMVLLIWEELGVPD